MDKGIKEAALCRPTHRRVWELLITEVFNHFSGQIHGDPPAVCKESINSSTGGRNGDIPGGMDMLEQGMTVPDLSWYYEERAEAERLHQTGGERLDAPAQLPHTTSRHGTWAEEATARAESKDIAPWGINSDSAKHPIDGRISGNLALPATRRMYHAMMRQAIQIYQMLKRGAFSARNWQRSRFVSGSWGEADNMTSPTSGAAVGEGLPVAHQVSEVGEFRPVENWDTACGAQDVANGDACEVDRRMLIAQEV